MYVTGTELIWFLLERTGKFIVTIEIYLNYIIISIHRCKRSAYMKTEGK